MFSLLVFHKLMAPVGLPAVTMTVLCVTVLWTVTSDSAVDSNW